MQKNKSGTIVSIAVSKKKGTRKTIINRTNVIENHGLENDAHAGEWHRQVSFLSAESIELAKSQGLTVTYGDFAENFVSSGIEWKDHPIGTRVKIGNSVELEITQIGKECHKKCAIYYQAGDCIMPREGIFARVIKGGEVTKGDQVVID